MAEEVLEAVLWRRADGECDDAEDDVGDVDAGGDVGVGGDGVDVGEEHGSADECEDGYQFGIGAIGSGFGVRGPGSVQRSGLFALYGTRSPDPGSRVVCFSSSHEADEADGGHDGGEGFVEHDFAVAPLAGVGEAVEIEVGKEEKEDAAGAEEGSGTIQLQLCFCAWGRGPGRGGRRRGRGSSRRRCSCIHSN